MPESHQLKEPAVKLHSTQPSPRNTRFAAWITYQGPVGTARYVVAVLAILLGPMPAIAQSYCDSIQLPKRGHVGERGKKQLAVWLDGKWHPFRSNAKMAVHPIDIGERDGLCMAWEAPPYKAGDKQIVYVSTRHEDGQPLSLFRNSAAAGVPVLWRLFKDWRIPTGRSGLVSHKIFRKFHGEDDPTFDVEIDEASRANFSSWHDTSAWFPNTSSRALVSHAVAEEDAVPYGAERLLLLQGARTKTSWVPFGTIAPDPGSALRVAVTYSGDLDVFAALQVYEYVFMVGE